MNIITKIELGKRNKERVNIYIDINKNILIKLEDKIVYFIKKKYDKDISVENTKKYLYEK